VHRANIGGDSRQVKADPGGCAIGPTVRPRILADYHWPVPVLSIDDAGDPRLADYRGIPDPELARGRGVFVAEGRLVVRRLLASRFTTRSVMVTPAALDAVKADLEGRPCPPVFVVPQGLMNSVAGFNIHRGCLAIGERPAPTPWEWILQAGLKACSHEGGREPSGPPSARGCGPSGPPPAAQCLVALERVGNADNVGATFRAAAAFGADGVLLDPSCADPLYRKAIRTSMGAALQVPFATDVPLIDALAHLRGDGWSTVGLTPDPSAPPARDVFTRLAGARAVLVLGHEGDGLTAAAAAACSHVARIPMTTDVDSLNVAMAAGIALYEWRQGLTRP
jgi:tRNA G18 (ribose-2'-O)-methylase SpoU